MRICLVRLPSPFLIEERAFPPLGLMAVGTSLKLAGHDVTIYDGNVQDVPMDFPAYGFGPTTPEYSYALKVKTQIRKINPKARIVIGGTFAILDTARCVSDGFDCVVLGDGEPVAEEAFTSNESIIVGGSYRSLDEYPIIDRSLIDLKRYKHFVDGHLCTTVISSRGCPWKCSFCCKTEAGVRVRSAEHVIKEIANIHYEYGYKAIAFPDDIFILDKQRTITIAHVLKDLRMKWRCLVRADLVVKYGQEFIHMMAESGCTDIGMGIESGSEKILASVNKGQDLKTVKQCVRMLKEEGMRVKGYFILGLPGETKDTLNETFTFLDEINLYDMDIKVYQPYPGSPIWKNKTNLDIDWNDMELEKMFYKGRPGEYYGNVRTSGVTNADINKAMNNMEIRFKRAR